MTTRQKIRISKIAAYILTGVLSSTTIAAPAKSDPCAGRINDTPQKLRECVKEAGISVHLKKLQQIADANNGERTAGTKGYDESLNYIAGLLSNAGYIVTKQEFPFIYYKEITPTVFTRTSPTARTYSEGADFETLEYSAKGDVTANVQAVGGIIIPPTATPSSASGCASTDFTGFVPGNIALIQRGTCTFQQKTVNAQNAGASAVIIFNEGQTGRTEPIAATLEIPSKIPVIFTSYSVGEELYTLSNATVRIKTDTMVEPRVTANLIADTPYGRNNSVIMLGAHLDSIGNAGINDNGSGSAALLEIALQMKNVIPLNSVRFAFWGAEEAGLVGSAYYVANLAQKGRLNDIEIYLNFDMIGSPNYIVDIYDNQPNLAGYSKSIVTNSATATSLFEQYFTSVGQPYEPRNGDPLTFGRSDHASFADAGIPFGGIITGADEVITPEQAVRYGSKVGIQADPCYHLACDDIKNVDIGLTTRMADAIATVLLTYAYDKKADGNDGKINYDPTQPKGMRKGHSFIK